MRLNQIEGFLVILFLLATSIAYAVDPAGPGITQIRVDNGTTRPATSITTSGGTIATIVLNATTQNPHWKAYVGNVSGRLMLEDAQGYSIYEWNLTIPAGEVYVTRNNSISWVNIRCANSSNMAYEDLIMNHTPSADDSITNTFTRNIHRSFWAANTEFAQNQCNHTLSTFVNGTAQISTSFFQEIVLWDNSNIVYATIMENSVIGFNRRDYDFQMIVPERGWDGPVTSTPYYFYVELV
jgi:hypothetical protein